MKRLEVSKAILEKYRHLLDREIKVKLAKGKSVSGVLAGIGENSLILQDFHIIPIAKVKAVMLKTAKKSKKTMRSKKYGN